VGDYRLERPGPGHEDFALGTRDQGTKALRLAPKVRFFGSTGGSLALVA
jgi:hypothetical protein